MEVVSAAAGAAARLLGGGTEDSAWPRWSPVSMSNGGSGFALADVGLGGEAGDDGDTGNMGGEFITTRARLVVMASRAFERMAHLLRDPTL